MDDVCSVLLTVHNEHDRSDVMMFEENEFIILGEIVSQNVGDACEMSHEDIRQEFTTTFHDNSERNETNSMNLLMPIEVRNVFTLFENKGDCEVCVHSV